MLTKVVWANKINKRMSKNLESTSLLHQPISKSPNIDERKKNPCQHFCLPSKSAILILFWTAAVGTVYHSVLISTAGLIYSKTESSDVSISTNDFSAYATLAFVAMIYPFSGLIADVYCGRLKTVLISLLCILAFSLLVCLVIVIMFSTQLHSLTYYKYSSVLYQPVGIIAVTIILFALAIYMCD